MKLNVALGGFPEFVSHGLFQEKALELARVSSIRDLMMKKKSQLLEQLIDLNQFDHVVYRLSGENPMEFIQFLRMQGLLKEFMRRKYKVSFWTMDSHHLGMHESRAQRYFDHVFVAHEEYFHLFAEDSSSILPCSFSLVPEDRVEQVLTAAASLGKSGVCAPFAAYPWQKRNRKYLIGMQAARDLQFDSFFGTVRGGVLYSNEAIIRKLLSFKATLNVSLGNDLNMRNFEALALNRVLITNRTRSHDLLMPWAENIIFVDDNFSDIKNKLVESQNLQTKDFSKDFLSKHSIRVRIEQMIETLTGHNLKLNYERLSDSGRPMPDSGATVPPIHEQIHSPVLLLARAQWPDMQLVKRKLSSGFSLRRSIPTFVRFWLASFFTNILAVTFGRSSTVRALLRILRRAAQSICK